MSTDARINTYTQEGLGLQRDTVHLVPHRSRWKRIFTDEAHLIYDELRLEQLRLFHYGSTSVPGIQAKPILDILGSVPSLRALDQRKSVLEAIGYEWKGEYGVPGRRYCVLYNSGKTHGFVHLHLFEEGNDEIGAHLAFRDILRRYPKAAAQYESEKLRLAASEDRKNYSEKKSPLIQEIQSLPAPKVNSVLAILGTAPGGGNTRSFLQERYPDAKVIALPETDLQPYMYGDAGDALEDAFADLVNEMLAADLVVFATPVYWYAMSGPMKDFFDRFSNLLRGRLKPLGEALYGKKVRLLSTGFDPRLPYGFEVPFASTSIYLGMDYLGAEYKSFQ